MNYFSRFVSFNTLLLGITTIMASSCIKEQRSGSIEPREDKAETVFVAGSDHKFYALDAQTGTKKWVFATNNDVIKATPAVSNGIVYAGGEQKFYALDATTGTEKWEFATPVSRSYIPVVGNRNVYILGNNNNTLYALDAITGTKQWEFTTGGNYSNPFVANGIIYVGGNDDTIYALDATTGAMKWEYKAEYKLYRSPILADGVIYAGYGNGKVYALDATTGVLKWTSPRIGDITGPVIYPKVIDRAIYLTDWYAVYSLDATTGAINWKRNASVIDNTYNTSYTLHISISDGIIYGTVSPLAGNSFIYALDAATGAKKWNLWPYPGILKSIEDGVLVTSGSLYASGADNQVHALDATMGAEKWTFTVGSAISAPLCVVTNQGAVINRNNN